MKNTKIIVGVNGAPTTRMLAKLAGLSYMRILNGKPIKENDSIDMSNTIGIRWGSRAFLETSKSTIIYNRSKNIKNASNKRTARILMNEAGISIPYLLNEHNVTSEIFPVIGRPEYHKGGKRVSIINSIEEYNPIPNWYYSQIIDKESEFRVHVAHGKVLVVMKKSAPTSEQVVWNRTESENPWTYVKWKDTNRNVMFEALKAVKCLGLDFGGVDVMLKNNIAYVLEVNTAPTLVSCPYVAGRYAKYFKILAGSNKRVSHWDFTVFEKKESLIWKNFQLNNFEYA